jgi:small subunit ribosomal protein S8
MPYSNINKAIGKVLVKEGFVSEIKDADNDGKKELNVALRYVRRKPVVSDVTIISKPSLRVYVTAHDLAMIQRKDAMTSIISTSQGIMTGKEAIKKGVGGELLFKIW